MHKTFRSVYCVLRAALSALCKSTPRSDWLQALLSFSTLFTPIPTSPPKSGINKVRRKELVELERLLEPNGKVAMCAVIRGQWRIQTDLKGLGREQKLCVDLEFWPPTCLSTLVGSLEDLGDGKKEMAQQEENQRDRLLSRAYSQKQPRVRMRKHPAFVRFLLRSRVRH